ncbi:MAG TPA: cysteine hydrolase [Burkholderiaceae bacterium]
MKKNTHLLIIDPQNDFCDLPESWLPRNPADGSITRPALPVAGAHEDMQRVAALIAKAGPAIAGISITIDSHHRLDIAHPTFWAKGDGSAVAPFTEIGAARVRAGEYRPRAAAALPRVLAYLDALEAAGRYRLMVWPVHCEIGTWGQSVHAGLRAAYNAWEEQTLGIVNKLGKGSNPWTEHYSAVMAEVPDADDPGTQLNRGFIDMLKKADVLYIAGEAGSHCVRATTEHIAENFSAEERKKLVLLTDCMSPVTGFAEQYEQFLAGMQAKGLRLAKSADILPDLTANA